VLLPVACRAYLICRATRSDGTGGPLALPAPITIDAIGLEEPFLLDLLPAGIPIPLAWSAQQLEAIRR